MVKAPEMGNTTLKNPLFNPVVQYYTFIATVYIQTSVHLYGTVTFCWRSTSNACRETQKQQRGALKYPLDIIVDYTKTRR
jgi:hypothetical protein